MGGLGGPGLLSSVGGAALGRVCPRTLDLAWGGPGGSWLQIVSASAPPACVHSANQLPFKSVTSFYFFRLSGLFLTTLVCSVPWLCLPGPKCPPLAGFLWEFLMSEVKCEQGDMVSHAASALDVSASGGLPTLVTCWAGPASLGL